MLPPPPTPLNRKPSFTSQSHKKPTPCKTTTVLNCANNCIREPNTNNNNNTNNTNNNNINHHHSNHNNKNNNNNIINNITNDNINIVNNHHHKNEIISSLKLSSSLSAINNTSTSNCSKSAIDTKQYNSHLKQPQQEQYEPHSTTPPPPPPPKSIEQYNNCQTKNGVPCDEDSLFFYHHEPIQYMPNYDTVVHNIPGKFNTIGPSSKYYNYQNQSKRHHHHQSSDMTKFYESTCNLQSIHNKSSNSLINGHQYFSNSLINFNYPQSSLNYHQFVDQTTNEAAAVANSQYLQFQNVDGDLSTMMATGVYGSKLHLATKHHQPQTMHHHHHHHHHNDGDGDLMHQQQLSNSTQNIPWRHRQCPSIGSSSSGTSIASEYI